MVGSTPVQPAIFKGANWWLHLAKTGMVNALGLEDKDASSRDKKDIKDLHKSRE